MGSFRKLTTFSAKGVPMDQTGLHSFGNVPAGATFRLLQVQIVITTPPSALANFAVTVGTNPTLYTNLAGARFTDLNMRNSDDRMALMEPAASAQPVPENTEIQMRVAAATTGPGVMDVLLVGFLL
jgi:hypothetical protein